MDKDTEKKSKKRDFIETTDGRIFAVQNDYELTDRDFYKVFLKNFMKAMEPVSNKKTQVIFWVLKHMTPGNEIKYTYEQIAKKQIYPTRLWQRPCTTCWRQIFFAGRGKS